MIKQLKRVISKILLTVAVMAGTLLPNIVRAKASVVTLEIGVNVQSVLDYSKHQFLPLDKTGTVTISFENSNPSYSDYGNASVTEYDDHAQITSSFTPLIGSDPFGTGLNYFRPYTFPNVSDYSQAFFEEFAAQGEVYSPSSSGSEFWAYHIETRITRVSPPRNDAGASVYEFTPDKNIKFLNDVLKNPVNYRIYFNEYWKIYDAKNSTYVAGDSWSDFNARLLSISSTSVPEPNSFVLLATGLLGLVVTRMNKKRLHR